VRKRSDQEQRKNQRVWFPWCKFESVDVCTRAVVSSLQRAAAGRSADPAAGQGTRKQKISVAVVRDAPRQYPVQLRGDAPRCFVLSPYRQVVPSS
jgi:hypothetical protein